MKDPEKRAFGVIEGGSRGNGATDAERQNGRLEDNNEEIERLSALYAEVLNTLRERFMGEQVTVEGQVYSFDEYLTHAVEEVRAKYMRNLNHATENIRKMYLERGIAAVETYAQSAIAEMPQTVAQCKPELSLAEDQEGVETEEVHQRLLKNPSESEEDLRAENSPKFTSPLFADYLTTIEALRALKNRAEKGTLEDIQKK